jgi:hypothetical protein
LRARQRGNLKIRRGKKYKKSSFFAPPTEIEKEGKNYDNNKKFLKNSN